MSHKLRRMKYNITKHYILWDVGKAGNWTWTGSTGPILPESIPEPGLTRTPKIPKSSARSIRYRVGTDLDRIGTGSYRIIVYR
ncbi:hypothetical protein H5410_017638 [Solanum commersonii]|uniref:Uncharacterized protein n=1 Tax=Solanum commersonii TaxID=4109 RepID=A0A9J5ZZM5_SOLCO|nr:hypothetical protein H5410_017638 [Solanum commersonii]